MTEKTQVCNQCGDEDRCHEYEGKFYCNACALGLLPQLKHEYFKSGDASLGWKIDDFWHRLYSDPRNGRDGIYPLEDASWLDDVENEGLADETIANCDYTVRIPMSHGVDSLNVAAASAVAFWQLGNK